MPNNQDHKVLVELGELEVTAILRALGEDDTDPECCSTCAAAVAATENLEVALASNQPQVREEWRVVYDEPAVGPFKAGTFELPQHDSTSLEEAESRAERSRPFKRNVRIQHRTVTTLEDGTTITSPWRDLDKGEVAR